MVGSLNCPLCRYGVFPLALGCVLALMVPACSRKAEIESYEMPRQEKVDSPHDFSAMPGAEAMLGPASQLVYEVPEGWKEGPAEGMRKAAFVVERGERKVEITVIDLLAGAGDLLPNVNRWRQQIQLAEFTQEELDKSVSAMQVAGVDGHYVELVGPELAGRRQAILGVVALREDKAWFFKLFGDAELALQEKERFQELAKSVRFEARASASPMTDAAGAGSPAIAPSGPSPLVYETPQGWAAGKVGGMRKAAFVVQDGEQKVEITAIDLAAAAGDLLPNVNRWRQQLQLDAVTKEQLDETSVTMQVDDSTGHYVELFGPEDAERPAAILGVVATHQNAAWFFKMSGDADLARREKDRFEEFVKSVKFAAEDGEGHDE